MPEIRIRYEDDSDRMPYEAIAEVVRAAGEHLTVTEFGWVRDDDLDDDEEPPGKQVVIRPDLSGFEEGVRRSLSGLECMTCQRAAQRAYKERQRGKV